MLISDVGLTARKVGVRRKMKISVVMATYNGAAFIIEQLDSIRLQSRKVDEVVISDDRSSDGTFEIVKKYIDDYHLRGWSITYDTIGMGLRDNFYNALSQVTGDLVFLADQDNRWILDKVAIVERIFMENPKIYCLNNSFKYMDEAGNEISFKNKPNTANNGLILHRIEPGAIEKIPISLNLNKNIGPGLAMAVRKEIVQLYLEFSRRIELHDFEINCIAAVMDALFFYNRVLDFYRIFEGQSVSIGIVKKRSKIMMLIEKIRSGKRGIGDRCRFIEELLSIESSKEIQEYLSTMLELQRVRESVAVWHHLDKWGDEHRMYKAIGKQYGNIDMRYCYIDLISALMPNLQNRSK